LFLLGFWPARPPLFLLGFFVRSVVFGLFYQADGNLQPDALNPSMQNRRGGAQPQKIPINLRAVRS
jgi:hypothetical protein